MTNNTDRPTTVTFPAGYKIRVYEQTASRDYTATIVPGTYPLEYTNIHYRPTDDQPYYVIARVQIDTPTRNESTVEFGGVALASREVQGARIAHTKVWYNYEVTKGEKFGGVIFA